MLIDSHAHLDFAEYGADLDATVARARDAQREVFIRQIRLAKALQKPLVVHTREADLETADILARELGPDGGVIHCFTSDWTAAQRYLALGMSLSFSGVLTFRNADA